jgi:hypothetical protein
MDDMAGHRDLDPLDYDDHGALSQPERYRVLHAAAAELVEELVDRYSVERTVGEDLDAQVAQRWPGSRAFRLVPNGPGPTLTLTLTAFPGVVITFGHNGHESFPACGCDLCAEEPEVEVARMRELVGDIVERGFSEVIVVGRRVSRYECTLVGADGSLRTQLRRARHTDRPPPAGMIRWPGWAERRPD